MRFDPNGAGPDGGPLYTETDFQRVIVEPFNGVSALFFLILALYWLYRLRGRYRENGFLVGCLLVLAIGGIGGGMFHAFRLSRVFLLMDFVPIEILALAVSVYFWLKAPRGAWLAVVMIGVLFGLNRFAFLHFRRQAAISLGYASIAVAILAPIVVNLWREHWRHGVMIFAAVLLFVPALLFRFYDPRSGAIFPMGTHWLWHSFSCAAVAFLIRYVEASRA